MEKHAHTRAVLNRMSRAIGHLASVKEMVAEGRECSEVLIQLSAVRAELAAVSKVILKDHIDHCIVDAVKKEDEGTIERLKEAVDRLL